MKHHISKFRYAKLMAIVGIAFCGLSVVAPAAELSKVEANRVAEVALVSGKTYKNPFVEIELNAVVTRPDGNKLRVPMFWAGGNRWCLRYASTTVGVHTFRTECSDNTNAKLHGVEGKIEVAAYKGENPLYRHGHIRVSKNQRHFEHADGTPFFWLGDTWWKCLCKRMSWEDFQELTADRKAKGFSLVQIVCGPYPDEGFFEPRWENEGGMPYQNRHFTEVNPEYFKYADRRLNHLVEEGIVPAIVGAWGRRDCDSMQAIGVDGLKRHWRNLVARYGAYPVVWILAGEIDPIAKSGQGPWAEVARYLRGIDPYKHPLSCHPNNNQGRRGSSDDELVIDYDMVGGSHVGGLSTSPPILKVLTDTYAKTPIMPVLCGETGYEEHMQQHLHPIQRHIFWMYMLSGAAGHTYGAAGVWHASVDGDPGIANVYDWTTWKEGMKLPGSTQLGLGKKLLEEYPWWRFESHPEWTEADCFAAGIPGEVRFIYQPRRNVYNWNGTLVKNIELDVPYHSFYFNPTNGKRYDNGTFISAGAPAKLIKGHTKPLLFEDRFEGVDALAWKDYGTASQRKDGRLVGGMNMTTIYEKVNETDLMASVDANSDAEAGIILRFHDADNYVVGIYSPSLKEIFFHDRKNGQWGDRLGAMNVAGIGPKIHLAAAACGDYSTLTVTDGKNSWNTPAVKLGNVTSGKAGVWHFQVGDRQEFGNFELSGTPFTPGKIDNNREMAESVINSSEYRAPRLPSPQDWVLVLERVKK